MRKAAWVVVIFLVVTGVAASIARAVFVSNLSHRAALMRERLGVTPPYTEAELSLVDNKFGDHPLRTWLHVIPGGIFLLLAPIQFVPSIRDRYLRVHRWLGRVLLVAALLSGALGLFFGLVRPIAGVREAAGIGIFGVFLFVCAVRGYVAIRSGDIDRHREWMIRTFAVALAISTVRIVMIALDLTHTLSSDHPSEFVIAIWSGWLITIAAAEFWIHYTRRSAHAHRLALHHLQQEPGS